VKASQLPRQRAGHAVACVSGARHARNGVSYDAGPRIPDAPPHAAAEHASNTSVRRRGFVRAGGSAAARARHSPALPRRVGQQMRVRRPRAPTAHRNGAHSGSGRGSTAPTSRSPRARGTSSACWPRRRGCRRWRRRPPRRVGHPPRTRQGPTPRRPLPPLRLRPARHPRPLSRMRHGCNSVEHAVACLLAAAIQLQRNRVPHRTCNDYRRRAGLGSKRRSRGAPHTARLALATLARRGRSERQAFYNGFSEDRCSLRKRGLARGDAGPPSPPRRVPLRRVATGAAAPPL
jgi:hypothetical protein